MPRRGAMCTALTWKLAIEIKIENSNCNSNCKWAAAAAAATAAHFYTRFLLFAHRFPILCTNSHAMDGTLLWQAYKTRFPLPFGPASAPSAINWKSLQSGLLCGERAKLLQNLRTCKTFNWKPENALPDPTQHSTPAALPQLDCSTKTGI